jgi:hypothetical protein
MASQVSIMADTTYYFDLFLSPVGIVYNSTQNYSHLIATMTNIIAHQQ